MKRVAPESLGALVVALGVLSAQSLASYAATAPPTSALHAEQPTVSVSEQPTASVSERPASPVAANVDDLAWMAGYWVRDAEGGRQVEELWLPPAGGVMLGLHRDVRADGSAWFEFLRIAAGEGGLAYWASPGGREPTPFHLVEFGERRAVFANPEHDFPQRILYWLEGDALHARIEGVDTGEAHGPEWSWRRAEMTAASGHAGHDLGEVDLPVSCSPAVQGAFNRAVALLHHMTYPQARQAFEEVAARDPRCAMAHWGVAMTLFQPLWPTRPGPADLQRGWKEVEKATALAPPTERERLFVAAVEAFFREPASPDYWARIRRWEAAMRALYESYPHDPEAEAFFALAHLATAPSDRVSLEHSELAARLLEDVYRQNPEHPGAMHYMIHANDVPGREAESLEIVRRYETVAPHNPHALHMPTHIYTRLGEWDAVVQGNLKAAEAALDSPAGEHGELVWDEFPHAIEYLVYAYLQKGEDDQAAAQLERLAGTAHLEPSFKTAFHLSSVPARFALERRAWDQAAKLEPREPPALPWDRFWWPEAITWFARGLGSAHTGALDETERSIRRLEELEAAAGAAGEDLFARNIRILRLELIAWLAQARGDHDRAGEAMRQATELEVATPKHAVTPAPTLPAYEQGGDLLLEQSSPSEALAGYQRSLELYPRRFNSLLGAARAARALGDTAQAADYYRRLLAIAGGGTRPGPLEEALSFVSRDLP